MNKSPVIVALDFAGADAACAVLDALDPGGCRVKVGKELFVRAGPAFVARVVAQGFDVFLDLKFHDIPHTVGRAVAAAADLGVWMLNVHALGGLKMMQAATAALEHTEPRPLLIAVTVLTSLADSELHALGLAGSAADNVARLAGLAQGAGMSGVVCSPREIAVLRAQFGAKLLLVTPGIRAADAPPDDQTRTATPREALALGADYLVIGRPITASADPAKALARILADIGG